MKMELVHSVSMERAMLERPKISNAILLKALVRFKATFKLLGDDLKASLKI